MSLFLCLSYILLGRYCEKNVVESRGFKKKKIKKVCVCVCRKGGGWGGGLTI